jgi:urease accessory protein
VNGRLSLRAGIHADRTVLLESVGTFPLQVMRPHAVPRPAGSVSLVLLLSGGLLDGDDVSIDVVVEPGARVALRTQAATQVHAGRSRHRLHAVVGEGAWLSYVPHAVVPHANADYHGQAAIAMHSNSRVLLAEALAPGRLGFGEQFAFTQVRLDLDVCCDGQLVARERGVVRPDATMRSAQFGAATHTAGVYVLGEGDPTLDFTCEAAEVGCSPLARGGWYVRAVANQAAAIDALLQRVHANWSAA